MKLSLAAASLRYGLLRSRFPQINFSNFCLTFALSAKMSTTLSAPDIATESNAFSEVDVAPTSICWKCHGAGTTVKRAATKIPGKNVTESVPCPTCRGEGQLKRTRSRVAHAKKDRSDVATPGIGPPPLGIAAPADCEELSFLTGQWKIYQHLTAHRYSTDDVVTAWLAWRVGTSLLNNRVRRTADIGCGIGSVCLMNAWLHPDSRCVRIEAQPARAAMAARSVQYNLGTDTGRVRVIQGDLRDPAVMKQAIDAANDDATAPSGSSSSFSDDNDRLFDLVTGTPPYFDVQAGGRPAQEESARCLFRYRGGMEQYCQTAAKLIARPHGLFVVVETALELDRSYASAKDAGLRVIARLDLIPKTGKPPLINVFVMCAEDAPYQPAPSGSGSDSSSSSSSSSYSSESSGSIFVTPAMLAPRGQSPYGEDPNVWDGIVARSRPQRSSVAADCGDNDAAAQAGSKRSSAPVVDESGALAGASSSSGASSAPAVADAAGSSGAQRPAKRPRPKQQPKPYPGSRHGEVVVSITVRGADDARMQEYQALLRDLGKPS